jgi:MFS family permease
MMVITVFGFVALVQFGFRMLMSQWFKLSELKNGLGWKSEEQVGYVNSMAGVVLIFFPLFCTPYLTRVLGVKKTCQLVVSLMVPITLFMPIVSHCKVEALLWVMLSCFIGFFISFTTVFTSVISIAATNTVSHELVGRAMGFCQSWVAIFRAIANGFMGLLCGWVISLDMPYPFNINGLFYLCGLFLILAVYLMSKFMGPEVEKRKKEKPSNEMAPLLDKQNK